MAKEVEHRQVIIVGAGPGGSSAAKRLAENGLDCLVLERREIIGNPAQCGECIPNWGEVVSTFDGLEDDEWLKELFDFPDHLRLHRLDKMRVFLPSGKHYSFDLDAFGCHRLQFDGHLADLAQDAGAEIRMSQALKNIVSKKDGSSLLVTDKGRYSADYIIDATGSLAHVMRLKNKDSKRYRPREQVPTLYAQVQGPIPDTFDVFMGSVAPNGYGWIIPKGKVANVGLGVRAGSLKGDLKPHLQRMCDELGFEILSWGGGWIPMSGPVDCMVDDNVLAIGDAAGLVMPSNGGGISQAMVSGKFAADAIIANHDTGRPLSEYEDRVRSCFSRALKNSIRAKKLAYIFFRWDWLTEVLMRIIGPFGGIRRAMNCERTLWLF